MDARRITSPRRINVLSLGKRHQPTPRGKSTNCYVDGGGVRGVSTLLILRLLMQLVNQSIKNKQDTGIALEDVGPHEIFDLVAGTSTGGLIAVMLGKLGMTVDECIKAYRDLSATIFGRKHIRGRVSGGLAVGRYSGSGMEKCVRALLHKHRSNEGLPMAADSKDKIAWYDICSPPDRELS